MGSGGTPFGGGCGDGTPFGGGCCDGVTMEQGAWRRRSSRQKSVFFAADWGGGGGLGGCSELGGSMLSWGLVGGVAVVHFDVPIILICLCCAVIQKGVGQTMSEVKNRRSFWTCQLVVGAPKD